MSKKLVHTDTSDAVFKRAKEETEKLGAINPGYYHGRSVMNFINEFKLSFCLGSVVTYIVRHRRKNGVEDLKKARWYLDEQIRLYETGEEDVE